MKVSGDLNYYYLATKILKWLLNFHVWWSMGHFISKATYRVENEYASGFII